MNERHPLFSATELTIVSDNGSRVLDNVSLEVFSGEVVALIGESGSGKTTLSLTALGFIKPGLNIKSGQLRFAGIDLRNCGERQLRSIRGRRVAYVAQSAAAAFNPGIPIDKQVVEPAAIHQTSSPEEALKRAHSLYQALKLEGFEKNAARYPHEVSGGQLQRFMAAMALSEEPELIVFDEPTTALDVTTQVGVLEAFQSVIRQRRVGGIYVSHDLAVVAQIADRIVVIRDGRIVEQGTTEEILNRPQQEYTKELLNASRKRAPQRASTDLDERPAILEVSNLYAGYGAKGADGRPKTLAVKNVNFSIKRGQVLAIVGESGSGKTTLGQVLSGLHSRTEGDILLNGMSLPNTVAARSRDDRRRVQFVFQSADTALNPRHTVERSIGRAVKYFWRGTASERERRVHDALRSVKLSPDLARRKPSALSGGQKQRVNLARALIAQPDILICDEITSALDNVVTEAVLAVVKDLSAEKGVSIIFISHDLNAVAECSDEILVMKNGDVVERGETRSVLIHPTHPYTQMLIDSVPELRVGWLEQAVSKRKAATARMRDEIQS